MWSRELIFAALAVYLFVVGCAVWSGSSLAPAPQEHYYPSGDNAGSLPFRTQKLTGLPYRGIAMQIQKVDRINEYEKSIDEIANLGADTVSIVVDCRQENGASERIFMDMRMTPSPEQLGRLIKHAKGRNLRVVLMPIILLDSPRGSEWRGTIRPDSWEQWFAGYRAVMEHYAQVAQDGSVDVFVVGSELVSTESKLVEWTQVIRAVRRIYKGQLTYSANWDHYRSIPFWDQLDLIGMNSYWAMGRAGNRRLEREEVTPEAVRRRWGELQSELFEFLEDKRKPLLFLEAGWCSVSNAAQEPWDYTQVTVSADPALQEILYEGFFRAWWGNPRLGGFMLWEWTPGDGGVTDRGYTPEGKPAEKVIRNWMKKEWKAQ